MNTATSPMVNRQYLIDLIQREAPELVHTFETILPKVDVLDCNQISQLLRQHCYQLQNNGLNTLVIREHLSDTQDGRLWFKVFTTHVLPFLKYNGG